MSSQLGGADATRAVCAIRLRCTLSWHSPIYILVFGIGYALFSQIHRFCSQFCYIYIYINVSWFVSLKLLATGANFWVWYPFCGEAFGFLPFSSAYFPPQLACTHLYNIKYILAFGIEYALFSQIHRFCSQFCYIYVYINISWFVSLKLLATGANFWAWYPFCGEAFGFLPLSSAYFPPQLACTHLYNIKYILVFGIEYALFSQIHQFCPNFAIYKN